MRYLTPFIIGALLFIALPTYALSVLITQQGGTGTTTPSGILYGDNGSTSHLNTVLIGSNLTFSGGTLSATGSGGTFPFTNTSYGVSTSTTIGFLGGLLSTASSTFTTAPHFASLTNALLGTDGTGLVVSTTSIGVNFLTGVLPESKGGTNQSTYTKGDLLYASNTNILSKLGIGTPGTTGILGTAAGIPAWVATSSLNLLVSDTIGTLLVPRGGTGAVTLTGLLQGNGAGAITGVTGTTGQFPYYNGTNTLLATSTLFLSAGGFIGVNTATPQAQFSVNGTASSTSAIISGLGTAAGAFLAVNPSGQIIATTTPSGSGSVVTATTTGTVSSAIAGVKVLLQPISVVSGDVLMIWGTVWSNGATCDVTATLGYRQSTLNSTTTIATVIDGDASGSSCSATAQGLFTSTTTQTVQVQVLDAGSSESSFGTLMVQKIH